jgi:hypothetical protein
MTVAGSTTSRTASNDDKQAHTHRVSTTTTRYSKWPALYKQLQQYLGESPQRHQYVQRHSHNVDGIYQCRLQMQQNTAVLAATDVVRQAYRNINHTTPFAPNPSTQRTETNEPCCSAALPLHTCSTSSHGGHRWQRCAHWQQWKVAAVRLTIM